MIQAPVIAPDWRIGMTAPVIEGPFLIQILASRLHDILNDASPVGSERRERATDRRVGA